MIIYLNHLNMMLHDPSPKQIHAHPDPFSNTSTILLVKLETENVNMRRWVMDRSSIAPSTSTFNPSAIHLFHLLFISHKLYAKESLTLPLIILKDLTISITFPSITGSLNTERTKKKLNIKLT